MESNEIQSQIDHRRLLLAQYRRRRQLLELQKAQLGMMMPSHLLMEIEDVDKEIERLKREIDILRSQSLFLSNRNFDDKQYQRISELVIASIETMHRFSHLKFPLQEEKEYSAHQTFETWLPLLHSEQGFDYEKVPNREDCYQVNRGMIVGSEVYDFSVQVDISDGLEMYTLLMRIPKDLYKSMDYSDLIKLAWLVNNRSKIGSLTLLHEQSELVFRHSLFSRNLTFDQIVAVLLYFEEMYIRIHDYFVQETWKEYENRRLEG